MRYLWLNYGKKLCGVPEGKIEKICDEITGVNLEGFFNNYLYGTKDLPLEELLSEFGVKLNLRATTSVDDKGGKPGEDKNQSKPVSIGARLIAHNLGAKVTQVFTNQSAELSGLSAGDIIIAINQLQVTKSTIDKVINSYSANEKLVVHAFRRDELKAFNLTLKSAELTTCFLNIIKQTKEQKEWLFL